MIKKSKNIFCRSHPFGADILLNFILFKPHTSHFTNLYFAISSYNYLKEFGVSYKNAFLRIHERSNNFMKQTNAHVLQTTKNK